MSKNNDMYFNFEDEEDEVYPTPKLDRLFAEKSKFFVIDEEDSK